MPTTRTPTRQTRSSRYDGHGNVRCAACRQYRDPAEFSYPPSRHGRPLSYCRDCQREIDHLRWRGERRARENARKLVQQRRRRQAERRARARFMRDAIMTLRRRGLTKTDISQLMDTSTQSLIAWERGERLPTPSMMSRVIIALRATAHLPLAAEPVARRRRPHPELATLIARTRRDVLAHPVRSRWGGCA